MPISVSIKLSCLYLGPCSLQQWHFSLRPITSGQLGGNCEWRSGWLLSGIPKSLGTKPFFASGNNSLIFSYPWRENLNLALTVSFLVYRQCHGDRFLSWMVWVQRTPMMAQFCGSVPVNNWFRLRRIWNPRLSVGGKSIYFKFTWLLSMFIKVFKNFIEFTKLFIVSPAGLE